MIKEIKVKNFMAHSELFLQDIPQINLIIGQNDTGKTGILKLLYTIVKSLEVYSLKRKSGDVLYKKELAEKLKSTFFPRKGLGELVKKSSKEKLEVDIAIKSKNYQQSIYFSFGEKTDETISTCTDLVESIPEQTINALFIPAKEVLTAFNDISSMRDNFYGMGFDDTYLDLIKALRLESSKGKVASELSNVNKHLEELFEGRIEQTRIPEQPFLFKKGNQQFSMQLTAEGIKKIGILTTLITNRQLGNRTILFMDEPETALHPNAIRKMVEMLVAMSKAGVQIFLASHSYFVIKQMALCAQRDQIDIKCWNIQKSSDNSINTTFEDLKSGILPDNSIINEALAMYNDDIKINLGIL
ncbi:AAA family ATPase [Flectobacillus roseus]|uniref:AAA family ATPase n=1 Tax=Flectobacillus roseus TaxID=502259 RepID=UPI0024B82B0A|nr:AAA family ATPase [Flectobacillus roseus]MDI9869201.1 AAA family ATPase [Flectobacillus roseus]